MPRYAVRTVRGTYDTPEAGTCRAYVRFTSAPLARTARRRLVGVACTYSTEALYLLYGGPIMDARVNTAEHHPNPNPSPNPNPNPNLSARPRTILPKKAQ